MRREEDITTSQQQLEAWKIFDDYYKRELEGDAPLQPVTRRTVYLPSNLQPVELVLRQQYAVREPDRPRSDGLLEAVGLRNCHAFFEAQHRVRNPFARAWGFLLSWVCELLVKGAEKVYKPKNFWIYPPPKDKHDWLCRTTFESGGSLHPLERCWGKHECELSAEDRRYRVSWAARQDRKLLDMRPVLE